MKFLYLLSLTCLIVFPLSAEVLMVNFGSSAVPGGEATDSPYHTVTAGFSDTTWNDVSGTADVGSGLLYSDGSAATGISLNMGSSTSSSTVDYDTNPASSNTLGDLGGIYSLTTMRSTTWNGGNSSSDFWVGIRVDGLAAAEYEIFGWGNNGNSSLGGTPMNFYTAAGASASTYDFTSVTPQSITNADNTSWDEGVSYSKSSVILSAGQSLFLAIDGSGSQSRGFLSGVQISVIPEASTLSLFGISLCALMLFRRRALRKA